MATTLIKNIIDDVAPKIIGAAQSPNTTPGKTPAPTVSTSQPKGVVTDQQPLTKAPVAPAVKDTPNPMTTRPGADSSAENPGLVSAVTRDVNQPTDTVSGQLTTLLDKNSPYIQQARNMAARQANSRGLINSSIAAGAGEEAAINAALPIAQQDATTYLNQGQTNQAAENRFKENDQAFGMNKATKEQEQRQTLDRMDVEDTYKRMNMKLESDLKVYNDKAAGQIQADLERVKTMENVSAQMKINYANNMSSLLNTYTNARSTIGASDKTPAAQAEAFKNLDRQFKADSDYLKLMTFGANNWNWD